MVCLVFLLEGTPAMTTRGFGPADFEKVALFVDRAIQLTKDINKKASG